MNVGAVFFMFGQCFPVTVGSDRKGNEYNECHPRWRKPGFECLCRSASHIFRWNTFGVFTLLVHVEATVCTRVVYSNPEMWLWRKRNHTVVGCSAPPTARRV